MADPSAQRALAAKLGRVGVWASVDRLAHRDAIAFASLIESLGFGALWFSESIGKEAFAHAALLLDATERIPIATGIANIWARDPFAMMNGGRTLEEAHPGRFILGIGVSHENNVRRRGTAYERPLEKMREYLDAMAGALYIGPRPAKDPPLVLAALGPKMLDLSAERTAGAHPYFVPLEHTVFARKRLGPSPLLAVEVACVIEPDADAARKIAREYANVYLRQPNYANNLKRLGWAEADIDKGGSDALIDAVIPHGTLEAVAARIRAHLDAGADHVCIQPLGPDQGAQLRELAKTLL